MDREQQLARYRHLRAVMKSLHSEAQRLVSAGTMLEIGRSLGLVQGRSYVLGSLDEFTPIADLAIYSGHNGRSRAIDRLARQVRFAPGSDEELMLRAAQNAWFTMWQVERKHETAGLVIRDTLRDETLRLMDIGLEASARPGFMFIGRLKKVEDFAMTCGISLLASRDLVEGFEATVPQFSERDRFKVFQNPRFATAMYRVAVKLGVFDRIREFDTDSGQDVAALAA